MDSGIGQFSGRAAPQVGFVETVENCSRKPRVVRRWPDVPWPLHIARSSALWHTGSAHWTVHCILHKAAHGICSLLTGRCIELGGVCCSLGRYWIRQTCLPSVGDSGAAGSSHRRPYLTSAKYFGFHLQLSLWYNALVQTETHWPQGTVKVTIWFANLTHMTVCWVWPPTMYRFGFRERQKSIQRGRSQNPRRAFLLLFANTADLILNSAKTKTTRFPAVFFCNSI